MQLERFIRDRALVFLSKNKDYGDSFYDSIQVIPDAGKVRILDKVNRIKSLLAKGYTEVSDETIEDTILDLFNYVSMHYAIDELTYTLSEIIKVMAHFVHNIDDFIEYTNKLLTIGDVFLGLSDKEAFVVVNKLNTYINRG